jgi:hypothetical protein
VRLSGSVARLLLGGLISVLGYLFFGHPFGGFSLGGAPSSLESRYKTEEEWLVDQVVRDVAEMGFYARHHRVPGDKDLDVSIHTIGPAGSSPVRATVTAGSEISLDRDLPLATSVWSPEEYEPVATALLRGWRLEPPTAAAERSEEALLAALTDPRGVVIERENQRASAELAAAMTDPARHEAAALIVASLALRERAEAFNDLRPLLCRMTAHLTLARALRGGGRYGTAGQYAEVALLALAGRGAEAEETLAALRAADGATPGEKAWLTALELRVKEDPRIVADPSTATLLERRELFRALTATRSADVAVEIVPHEDPVPDWARLIRDDNRPSVQTSNELTPRAVDLELAEVKDVWSLARGGALPGDLASALNAPAERAITADGPRILGWGTWAAGFQRHIAAQVLHQDAHLRRDLGLPEQADGLAREMERQFAGLTLYPFVDSRLNMNSGRHPERFDEAVTLAVHHPELIAPANWWGLEESARYEVVRRGAPQRAQWFSTGLPRGTAHDFSMRRTAGVVKGDAASVAALRALSPNDMDLAHFYLATRYGNALTIGEAEKEYGRRAEYDMRVASWMAAIPGIDTPARKRVLARMCAVDADNCASLGLLLVEAGDDAGAAKAFQRMFDFARDRVLAANESRWLMDHYYDRGERKRAAEVAATAAATGSYMGLRTQSAFLEREGDYAAAEALLQAMKDRYGQDQRPSRDAKDASASAETDDLMGFYYRMAVVRGDHSYQAKFDALAAKVFPKGLERIEAGGLGGHPEDGVAILTASDTVKALGLRPGDIIVALDGWRVHNLRQYRAVSWFYGGLPGIKLVAWHHPAYTEVTGRVTTRSMGAEMRSYEPNAAVGN